MAAKSEIMEMLVVLAGCFANVQLNQQNYDSYCKMLADIPTEVLDVVCQQVATECKFFPTVAELRERALKLTVPQRPTAAEAWGTVMSAITKYGFYQNPEFADPLITRAVQIMDWKQLCSAELDTIGVTRGQFMKVYDQLAARETEETRLLPRARALRDFAGRPDLGVGLKETPKELPAGDLVGPTPEFLEALENYAKKVTME